jgi:predicted CXXCH cytochrome family protein
MKRFVFHIFTGGLLVMFLLTIMVTYTMAQVAETPIKNNCALCHGGESPLDIPGKIEFKEWETSVHAKSLEDVKASDHAADTCLKCMGASSYKEDPNVTLETATAGISCSACHNHGSSLENNLQASAADICAQCHSRQPKIFGGTGVADVVDMPSMHSKIMPEKCVTCHMPKEGEEVATEGGHTFKPDVKVCKTCHTDPEAMVAAVQTDVTNLLDGLKVKLDAATEEEKKTDLYKAVNGNYGLLNRDGSSGVHNYFYAKAVLGYSYVGT